MAEFSVDDTLQIARDASGLPLVSVIIPAYNYEGYVGFAIKSALVQSYPNVEIIVVDDGSTDCTAEVVHSFASRVSYIRKSNGGLSSARNLGIRMAKGEFLLFLDADDELEPETIERMYDAFSNLSSDYALIASRFTKINDVGDVIGSQGNAPAGDVDISCRQLVLRNRFPVTALIRRIVITECGMFDPEYGTVLGSEDRDMWVRMSAMYKIYMLTKPLLRKRVHGLNMSSHALNQSKGMIRTISKARSSGVVSRLNFPFWAQVGAIRRFQVALMRRDCGDRSGAWWELLKSALVWPWFYSLREVGLAPLFRMRCMLRWIIDRHS